jgi:hypothetical protein
VNGEQKLHPYHEAKHAESIAKEARKMTLARHQKREAAGNRVDERDENNERKGKLAAMSQEQLAEQHRQERVLMSRMHAMAGYTDSQRNYSFNELDRKHRTDWRLFRLVHKEKEEAELERKVFFYPMFHFTLLRQGQVIERL